MSLEPQQIEHVEEHRHPSTAALRERCEARPGPFESHNLAIDGELWACLLRQNLGELRIARVERQVVAGQHPKLVAGAYRQAEDPIEFSLESVAKRDPDLWAVRGGGAAGASSRSSSDSERIALTSPRRGPA